MLRNAESQQKAAGDPHGHHWAQFALLDLLEMLTPDKMSRTSPMFSTTIIRITRKIMFIVLAELVVPER